MSCFSRSKDRGDHLITSAPIDKDELSNWKKCDAKARAIIEFTLSDNHLDHVRDVTTTADEWKSICDLYQKKLF